MDVLPVPSPVEVAYLLAYILVGFGIGVAVGWFFKLAGQGRCSILKDGVFGSLGYLTGLFSAVLMPWPRSTITQQLESGTILTDTVNNYPHPERVAVVVAILLPLLNELFRSRKRPKARRT